MHNKRHPNSWQQICVDISTWVGFQELVRRNGFLCKDNNDWVICTGGKLESKLLPGGQNSNPWCHNNGNQSWHPGPFFSKWIANPPEQQIQQFVSKHLSSISTLLCSSSWFQFLILYYGGSPLWSTREQTATSATFRYTLMFFPPLTLG